MTCSAHCPLFLVAICLLDTYCSPGQGSLVFKMLVAPRVTNHSAPSKRCTQTDMTRSRTCHVHTQTDMTCSHKHTEMSCTQQTENNTHANKQIDTQSRYLHIHTYRHYLYTHKNSHRLTNIHNL